MEKLLFVFVINVNMRFSFNFFYDNCQIFHNSFNIRIIKMMSNQIFNTKNCVFRISVCSITYQTFGAGESNIRLPNSLAIISTLPINITATLFCSQINTNCWNSCHLKTSWTNKKWFKKRSLFLTFQSQTSHSSRFLQTQRETRETQTHKGMAWYPFHSVHFWWFNDAN